MGLSIGSLRGEREVYRTEHGGQSKRDKIPYRFLARDLDLAAFFRGLVLAGSGWRIAGGSSRLKAKASMSCSTFLAIASVRGPGSCDPLRHARHNGIQHFVLVLGNGPFPGERHRVPGGNTHRGASAARPRPAQFAPPSVCDESPALLRADLARFDSGGVTFVGGGWGTFSRSSRSQRKTPLMSRTAESTSRGIARSTMARGRFVRLCTIVSTSSRLRIMCGRRLR